VVTSVGLAYGFVFAVDNDVRGRESSRFKCAHQGVWYLADLLVEDKPCSSFDSVSHHGHIVLGAPPVLCGGVLLCLLENLAAIYRLEVGWAVHLYGTDRLLIIPDKDVDLQASRNGSPVVVQDIQVCCFQGQI